MARWLESPSDQGHWASSQQYGLHLRAASCRRRDAIVCGDPATDRWCRHSGAENVSEQTRRQVGHFSGVIFVVKCRLGKKFTEKGEDPPIQIENTNILGIIGPFLEIAGTCPVFLCTSTSPAWPLLCAHDLGPQPAMMTKGHKTDNES